MKNTLFLFGVFLRESIRNKVLWFFALAGALMILAALVLGEMVVGRPGKAIWDLGLSSINLLSLAIIVTFGVSMASSELEGRMMQLLLVKPLSRRQYLAAIYMTLMSLVLIASLSMALISWALLGFSTMALVILAVALIWNLLEMSVMGAVVLFCATLSAPQLAMFLGLCFYIIGHSLSEALRLVTVSGTALTRGVFAVLYFILPNLSLFNKKSLLASGLTLPDLWSLLWAGLYAVCCVLIWAWLAQWLFGKKEL